MMVLSWLHEKAHLPYCPNYASASAKKKTPKITLYLCTVLIYVFFISILLIASFIN